MEFTMKDALETLKKALKSIAEYTEKKKPTTLAEAKGMLAVISVIASESLFEIKTDHLGRPVSF
jgi:hypothetical protein